MGGWILYALLFLCLRAKLIFLFIVHCFYEQYYVQTTSKEFEWVFFLFSQRIYRNLYRGADDYSFFTGVCFQRDFKRKDFTEALHRMCSCAVCVIYRPVVLRSSLPIMIYLPDTLGLQNNNESRLLWANVFCCTDSGVQSLSVRLHCYETQCVNPLAVNGKHA
ncbi:hypothetical protein, conserved in T. vivax [Trypanosoma vivax Y486]|uniref:Uncharacterized protein n=1 Tax=Trypanosoma vivax (strain Y486) TaxID=1055687 RepID=F9WME1_TRYVY|nr:hypothetical protein, conserved in T. vivax [Trypanosoma vivax Y486]|eukprot:CCD18696.1 hypothetical protein, conserved in T. vivax [Trypanosoma vivax Y486]